MGKKKETKRRLKMLKMRGKVVVFNIISLSIIILRLKNMFEERNPIAQCQSMSNFITNIKAH